MLYKFKSLALYWLKIIAHINLVEAFKILLDKSVIQSKTKKYILGFKNKVTNGVDQKNIIENTIVSKYE